MDQFKKEKTRIHFVCTGNIFRSRLAEAYLRSIAPNIRVSSSGTKASLQNKGSIVWYAQRILFRNNLLAYMKSNWSDTTKQDLQNADLVVFIGQKNYDFCREKFDFDSKYLIWNLPDFDDRHLNGKPTDITEEIKYLKMSEDIWFSLKKDLDDLIKDKEWA